MPVTKSRELGPADGPLYLRIVRALTDEITGGVTPVGTRLQPEANLSNRFNVSRHTIREALRHLRNEGLIKSRQGSGWVVAATGQSRQYVHSVSSVVDLFQYTSETRLQLVSCEVIHATGKLAARLGCSPGREWLRMEGIRYGQPDDRPICWVVVYLASAYKELAENVTEIRGPLFTQIEERFGVAISEITQTIRVGALPKVAAPALGIAPDDAVFEMERSFTTSDRKLVEISFSYYPAETFSYSITLKRELGASE
ncbi:GntR family transcriptional regulator [Phenylobacterium sp.]|uniref:GntR family transcriptional regulator n=1 Tax=Phenylobacterium sp. TaxID=1871053 RepID=UPI00301E171C